MPNKKNKSLFLLVLSSLIIFSFALNASATDVADMAGADSADDSTGSSVSLPISFDPAENDDNLTTINRLTFLSGGNDPLSISINIINTALGFLGLCSILVFLYAGLIWFKASDNEEEINKAKQIIIGAIIGLLLTLGALGTSLAVFNQLTNVTSYDSEEYDASLSQ